MDFTLIASVNVYIETILSIWYIVIKKENRGKEILWEVRKVGSHDRNFR